MRDRSKAHCVLAEAKPRFAAFVKDTGSLDVNLRGPVIFLAGREADHATYDELRALGRKATSTEERNRYYIALASAINPELPKAALSQRQNGPRAVKEEWDEEKRGAGSIEPWPRAGSDDRR